jgi:single-strand DNA-binding protein
MKNQVFLIGRIGKDAPVLKSIEGGKHVTTFSLATESTYKNKEGEKQKDTTWHNIEMWNKENVAKFLKPGMLLHVEGSIVNDKYDKQIGGEKVVFHTTKINVEEIILLEPKKD